MASCNRGALNRRRRRGTTMRGRRALGIGWLAAGCLAAGCALGGDVANRGSTGETIICFGDSLTEGYGVAAGRDFPSLLAKGLQQDVINAGVSGDTTTDALR